MSDHQIGHLEVEVCVADVDLAAALSERTSRLLRRGLAATIERVCDEVSGPERLDRLDHLTLDLGRVSVDGFEGELLRALEPALLRALREALGGGAGGSADRVAASIERLEAVALTGNLPWSVTRRAGAGAAEPIREATLALVELAPAALFELLEELVGDPLALARLAAHLDLDALAALIGRRFAGSAGALVADVRRLAGAVEGLAALGPRRQVILRAAILAAAARPETRPSTALAAILRAASARGLAVEALARVDPSPALRRALAEVVAATPGRRARPAEGRPDDADSIADSIGHVDRHSSGHLDAPPVEEPAAIERGADEIVGGEEDARARPHDRGDRPDSPGSEREGRSSLDFDTGSESSPDARNRPISLDHVEGTSDARSRARSLDRTEPVEPVEPVGVVEIVEIVEIVEPVGVVEIVEFVEPVEIVEIVDRPDSPRESAAHRSRELATPATPATLSTPVTPATPATPVTPVTPATPAIPAIPAGSIVDDGRARSPGRRDPPVDPRARAARERLAARRRQVRARLEELYVDDAGLVILWPFLDRLCARAGLLGEDGGFVDEAARAQAIALLSVIARDDPEPPEPALPLAKLLCGAEVDAPFELSRPLVDAQRLECERLLLAVLDHAPALGELGVDDLRATFLRRPAALAVRDGLWTLVVERRPQDLVLDRFPWTWRWFRLPWMSAPMRVEW